eukprot:maker-scaffold715_size107919-snap-gene-0.19 protein:Tk04588 transcript:maker-scaffold715_size107919-snap-gene-0.19-mRNA-1 annotation:"hypothetical protein"
MTTTEQLQRQPPRSLPPHQDTKYSKLLQQPHIGVSKQLKAVEARSDVRTHSHSFKVNGSGAFNDQAQVIIAKRSLRPALQAQINPDLDDPFACTCHLYQAKPQEQTRLHWSSSESTLGGAITGAVDSARHQRLLHHPHYHQMHHHHPSQKNKLMVMSEEEWQRRQLQYQQYLERVSSISDSQINCDGQCCCEWLGRALLCSCQLPSSSSDEAPSPSHKNNGTPAQAAMNGHTPQDGPQHQGGQEDRQWWCGRKEGSGGNGLKRNEAFLKSLEAKIKADPTASMRRLADEFDVDEITIRRAITIDNLSRRMSSYKFGVKSGAWTRPVTRMYSYNFQVGENYYYPMTSYLDTKYTDIHAQMDVPGALSFRGIYRGKLDFGRRSGH